MLIVFEGACGSLRNPHEIAQVYLHEVYAIIAEN